MPPRRTTSSAVSSSSVLDSFSTNPEAPALSASTARFASACIVSTMALGFDAVIGELAHRFESADVRHREIQEDDVGPEPGDGVEHESPVE